MKYYITPSGDFAPVSELRHAFQKGAEREQHKYVKREWKNGRWQYFYPEDLKGGNKMTTIDDRGTKPKGSIKAVVANKKAKAASSASTSTTPTGVKGKIEASINRGKAFLGKNMTGVKKELASTKDGDTAEIKKPKNIKSMLDSVSKITAKVDSTKSGTTPKDPAAEKAEKKSKDIEKATSAIRDISKQIKEIEALEKEYIDAVADAGYLNDTAPGSNGAKLAAAHQQEALKKYKEAGERLKETQKAFEALSKEIEDYYTDEADRKEITDALEKELEKFNRGR